MAHTYQMEIIDTGKITSILESLEGEHRFVVRGFFGIDYLFLAQHMQGFTGLTVAVDDQVFVIKGKYIPGDLSTSAYYCRPKVENERLVNGG